MAYRTGFQALADTNRQRLLERLLEGPQPVGRLARGMPVSRPAVSQHLRVLKEADLVRDHREGSRRVYEIDPRGLGALRAWLDQLWERVLAGFAAEIETGNDQTEDRSDEH